MPDENKNGSVDLTGSPSANQVGPSEGTANTVVNAGGEPKKSEVDLSNFVPKQNYEELAQKLGQNSEELGNFRQFFKEVGPLLDKLQDQPEIVEAVMEGKLTSELAQAILEGKTTIEDATNVAQAHEQVKKELGQEKYSKTAPDKIEEMVNDKLKAVDSKLDELSQKLTKGLSEVEEKHEFTDKVTTFIEGVADFEQYAEGVVEWLEEHPAIYDIETAYFAVKGKVLAEQAQATAEVKAAEEQKNLAANAAGGQSQGRTIVTDKNIIDELIAPRVSPNN